MAAEAIGKRKRPDWTAAVWAGLIAGLVFMMLEMIMVPVFLGGSPWGPPRMIGAMVLGEGALPPPATFDLGILMVTMMVHLVLSIAFAIVLALIIARMGLGPALAVGGLYGLGLYLFNFYVMTAVFPWFANARNWVSIVSHILFGVIAAWVYESCVARAPTQSARPQTSPVPGP